MPHKHAARRTADQSKVTEQTDSDTAVDTPVVVHERVQFDISKASTADAPHEPNTVIKHRRRRSICLPRKHASRKKKVNAKIGDMNIYGSPQLGSRSSSPQQESLPRSSQHHHIPVSLDAEPIGFYPMGGIVARVRGDPPLLQSAMDILWRLRFSRLRQAPARKA